MACEPFSSGLVLVQGLILHRVACHIILQHRQEVEKQLANFLVQFVFCFFCRTDLHLRCDSTQSY